MFQAAIDPPCTLTLTLATITLNLSKSPSDALFCCTANFLPQELAAHFLCTSARQDREDKIDDTSVTLNLTSCHQDRTMAANLHCHELSLASESHDGLAGHYSRSRDLYPACEKMQNSLALPRTRGHPASSARGKRKRRSSQPPLANGRTR